MGERIAALRIAAGLKPVELARRIGIAQPSLHAIEHNRTKTLKAETLTRLCSELHTTADYILRGGGNEGSCDRLAMESELIYAVRTLTPERRLALLEYARFLVSQQPSQTGTKPDPKTPHNVTHLPKHAPKRG